MSFAKETVTSPTGARLMLHTRHADGTVRGVVQINHGLAEHSARYARFADFLAERGYHVYAHDHLGHGETTAPDAPLGSFGKDGAARVIADVVAVHDLIGSRHPGLPVIVFGHSMGGQVALDFARQHSARLAGAAVWNANLTAGLPGYLARTILAWERMRLGSDVPSRVLPKLTFQAWATKFPNRRTEFDWLSRDEAEVDKYVADPLCGWDASVGMWQDIFKFTFACADAGNFDRARRDLPFHLVGGEKDPATSGGRAIKSLERRLRGMGFSNLVSTVYPQTRHESLNELNRDIIMEDFARWADTVVQPSPAR